MASEYLVSKSVESSIGEWCDLTKALELLDDA